MSETPHLDALPTLATLTRHATPKHALPTKLDRVVAKQSSSRAEAKRFRDAVWKRDGHHCRVCQSPVTRTLAYEPRQGQVHHVRGRNVAPEHRYEVSQAMLLCATCHEKVQRHELTVPIP